MPTEIHVHLLPDHFSADQLQGGIAVVVDVLRASTTILTALHSGAAGIIPCLSVDDAEAHRNADTTVLLGGERGGIKLDGFDLSNSPTDYSSATVANRTIAFTTTNGTRALLRSVEAEQVLIGSFANVGCLAEHLHATNQPLHLVCAGTNREMTGEDILFAGCLIDRIVGMSDLPSALELTDSATMTLGWWRYESAQRPLAETLKQTRGGKNLMALSYDNDVELAAELDCCPVLARFSPSSGLITT
jgi:2-phosphosulfolactate phosphatase